MLVLRAQVPFLHPFILNPPLSVRTFPSCRYRFRSYVFSSSDDLLPLSRCTLIDTVSSFFNSSFSSLLTYFLDFLLGPRQHERVFLFFAHNFSCPIFLSSPSRSWPFLCRFFLFLFPFLCVLSLSSFFFFHFPVPLLVRLLVPCFTILSLSSPTPYPLHRHPHTLLPFRFTISLFQTLLIFPYFFPLANANFFLHPLSLPAPICPHSSLSSCQLCFSFYSFPFLITVCCCPISSSLSLSPPLFLEPQFPMPVYLQPRITTHHVPFSIDANLCVSTQPFPVFQFPAPARSFLAFFFHGLCPPSCTFHNSFPFTARLEPTPPVYTVASSLPLSLRLLTSLFLLSRGRRSFFGHYYPSTPFAAPFFDRSRSKGQLRGSSSRWNVAMSRSEEGAKKKDQAKEKLGR